MTNRPGWWLSLLLVVGMVLGGGCGGCDDEAGAASGDEACVDLDGDGAMVGEACLAPGLDCDDADASIYPGAVEVCGDGIDNDCSGAADDACAPCDDGDTEACGSDEGICEKGVKTCEGGVWGACEGGVSAGVEVCDGVDNDCDGETDENPQRLCNDEKVCNGVEICVDGSCQAGEEMDCSELAGPCMVGACSEKDGGCRAYPREDGSSCDDGLFCTENSVCQAGDCVGEPTDCSAAGDTCNAGICDEEADACVSVPVSDGTSCDDGAFCTSGDVCTAGSCAGTPRDCSAESDQCNTGVCDEVGDTCAKQPVADDTACEDGAYCTVGDTCQGGSCTAGSPRECGVGGGSCRTGVCDEANDTCDGDPVPDDTPCSDGRFCTVDDRCQAGSCVGGGPRDCSAVGDNCNDPACNETQRCHAVPKADGVQCDDGRFCTTGDVCSDGSCGGTPRSCDMVADACNDGVCNEAQGACLPTPKSDGTACPDGLFCTIGDICLSGACDRQPRNCASAGDACNTGVCSESQDDCVAQPKPDGTSCDDGQFCTEVDRCSGGSCLGAVARDCSAVTGGDACLAASCNESADACEAEEICCDSSADSDLDGANDCDDCQPNNGAVYPGRAEVCNGADDDCDGLIDEDFDVDSDGYSVCSTDPAVFDCDDTNAGANPGLPETCNPDGSGNGTDENCNGYVDETCNCSGDDADADGVSDCAGDCDDADADVHPGAEELCDGKDNDCNTFTRPNCGVSDPCNFDLDGDGDTSNDPDICQDDMICACILGANGSCTGDYRCTSFCNSSATGEVGDGCAADQSCFYDLLYSANIHGCGVQTDAPGTKSGGEACSGDSECRSLSCEKICVGPGCNQTYCTDYCGSDAYCPAAGTVCRVAKTSSNIDGRCWPEGGPFLGTKAVGQSCSSDFDCDHGLCVTDANSGSKYCTEACCADSDCPGGYTCGLRGDNIDTLRLYTPPGSPGCSADGDCDSGFCYQGTCSWRIAETSPVCIKDVGGQLSRVAGQACSSNSQCESNFCEASLGVCVDVCCSDAGCADGTTCEQLFVEASGGFATQSRVCVNLSTDEVLRRR